MLKHSQGGISLGWWCSIFQTFNIWNGFWLKAYNFSQHKTLLIILYNIIHYMEKLLVKITLSKSIEERKWALEVLLSETLPKCSTCVGYIDMKLYFFTIQKQCFWVIQMTLLSQTDIQSVCLFFHCLNNKDTYFLNSASHFLNHIKSYNDIEN